MRRGPRTALATPADAATRRDGASPAAVWAALAAVYVVWGSTYLAIRVVVETMPPFLSAGVRFVLAGAILYAWTAWRGSPRERPTAAQWRAAAIIGTGLLVGGNGLVSVAEERVASGITALIIATVPLWMAVFGWVFYRDRLPRLVLAGLAVGFGGVALLVDPSGADRVDSFGALLLVVASASWAAGSLYARGAPAPSQPLLGTSMQMLAGGGLQLVVGVARGELGRVDIGAFSRESWIALAYLVFIGSLVGFTAYAWLLRNARTSLVSTYAYVNPVVAVVLGALILDEVLTGRMIAGGALIVVAVALIVAARAPRRAAESAASVAAGRDDVA